MDWVVAKMKWIMLVSGALTCTMLYAFIAPQASLQATFGETLQGPVAEIVVRNWGALIALVGAMLIYGAYHPPVRPLVLTVAGASKLIFIGLVMSHGKLAAGQQSVLSIAVDLAMVVLFAVYLVRVRRHAAA